MKFGLIIFSESIVWTNAKNNEKVYAKIGSWHEKISHNNNSTSLYFTN